MIDGRLPEPWPAEVIDAMRQWRQGYVVERAPFFYQPSVAHPVWRVAIDADDVDDDTPIVLDVGDRPPFGLITTQTCDLFEESRPRQPWFAVAPVYDYGPLLRSGQLRQLQRGQMGHLILLTAGWLPPGQWVADLRIEVPVEKGWLVGRDPRPGFASQHEFQRVAARLASRRGRPALSPQLSAALTAPLREWLQGGGRASREGIDSIRARVAGDPAESNQAEVLVIIGDEGLASEELERWREWERGVIAKAADAGVQLIPFRYGSLDRFTARDVETSLRLDLDYLSPDTM